MCPAACRCPASSGERRRRVHGRHEGRSLRHRGRPGARVALPSSEPERQDQRRRPETVGERHGPDQAAGREVDRRLRVDDVSRRRGAVRRAVPMGEEHVHPMRQQNRRAAYREYWWRHVEPRQGMWRALDGLSRYIATPTVAKHRLFAWWDVRICPDHQLIVTARDDDTTFGSLHSRFHEVWSLRLGTSLEDRPRYTPSTTFETFPFPAGLAPNVPVELRDRWLNPPEWVEWVDEPAPGYPRRPVLRDSDAAQALRKRTLTNLYNARPQWLVDAHAALNAAVAGLRLAGRYFRRRRPPRVAGAQRRLLKKAALPGRADRGPAAPRRNSRRSTVPDSFPGRKPVDLQPVSGAGRVIPQEVLLDPRQPEGPAAMETTGGRGSASARGRTSPSLRNPYQTQPAEPSAIQPWARARPTAEEPPATENTRLELLLPDQCAGRRSPGVSLCLKEKSSARS